MFVRCSLGGPYIIYNSEESDVLGAVKILRLKSAATVTDSDGNAGDKHERQGNETFDFLIERNYAQLPIMPWVGRQ